MLMPEIEKNRKILLRGSLKYSNHFKIWVLALLIAVFSAACTSEPRPLGVQFPADYRAAFAHYATVDRPDGVIRDIYIDPAGLRRLTPGRALPLGTIIVIEAFDALRDDEGNLLKDENGHLIKGAMKPNVHVAEKRSDWRAEDFESGQLSDDWNFGSYLFADGTRFNEPLTACFNCHNATAHEDFTWSLPLLLDYYRTRETQYFYCDLTGRTACEF